MTSNCEHLDDVYQAIGTCKNCTENDEIRALADAPNVINRFMFHWLPFREGNAPFRYIFFAMEPSTTGVAEGEDYPQEGGFHTGLRFAIRKYLLSSTEKEGFLITNMAKCTIAGALCQRTRRFRWDNCSRFLEQEIQLSRGRDTRYISIGKAQIGYITANQDLLLTIGGRQVHYLTHYSPRNWYNFRNYADQRTQEFDTFRRAVSEEFRAFLVNKNADYELRQFEKNPRALLAMLFKWKDELSMVRREEI